MNEPSFLTVCHFWVHGARFGTPIDGPCLDASRDIIGVFRPQQQVSNPGWHRNRQTKRLYSPYAPIPETLTWRKAQLPWLFVFYLKFVLKIARDDFGSIIYIPQGPNIVIESQTTQKIALRLVFHFWETHLFPSFFGPVWKTGALKTLRASDLIIHAYLEKKHLMNLMSCSPFSLQDHLQFSKPLPSHKRVALQHDQPEAATEPRLSLKPPKIAAMGQKENSYRPSMFPFANRAGFLGYSTFFFDPQP